MYCNIYIREYDLMREVLFALQGLNGKIIRQDVDGRFKIIKSHIGSIDPTQRMLLEKLTSFGWLVNKIKSYITPTIKDPTQGKVSQCLAAALNNELLEYYHMVTQIEQQLQKSANHDNGRTRASTPTSEYGCSEFRGGPKSSATCPSFELYNGHGSDDGFVSIIPAVTLHQVHVWSLEHFFRLKTLAMLAECCKGEKGGHLAGIVFRFMQQGDKQIRAIIYRILGQVSMPIRHMLSQWIFHGEIQDPFEEFFIRLGEKDYIIDDYMMPGFISRQQANKILATGKAIHLLRKVCTDSVASSVPGYDDLKKSFESTSIESLFRSEGLLNCGEENEFEYLLNTAYEEVSQKALALLFGSYKLRSHFRGLRQYLLLGQGDFIRHLMDLLKSELDKPSSECRFHNILSVLESAMRSTNAQFDDDDVTSRVDCRLLDATAPGASGWDIFSLVYRVDGPISAIFTNERLRDYIEIFRQLWRTKRVEHVLTSLWSSQMFYSKKATNVPSLSPAFHRANILLSDMIHFMQHFQNFIMFEVVECSWVELVTATDVAKDVDDVIAAHDNYLRKIRNGTLSQNKIIFDCILEFEQLMNSLWTEFDGVKNNPNSYLSRIDALGRKFQINQQTKSVEVGCKLEI